MKNFTLLSILFVSLSFAQNINFTDQNLKNVLVNYNTIDTDDDGFGEANADLNSDGEISMQEAASITALSFSSRGISSLDDLINFPNLEAIVAQGNRITNLNLSSLTNLRKLDLTRNSTLSIDLTGNVNLEELSLKSCNLVSVDLSQNINLTNLDLSDNSFTSFMFTQLTDLQELNLSNNDITSIDISSFTQLEDFAIKSNLLTALDASTTTNLKTIDASFNDINTVNVTGLTILEELNLSSQDITAIDISTLVSLVDFNFQNNRITQIDITNNVSLVDFNVQGNNLTSLDISNMPNLEDVTAFNNRIVSVTLGNTPQLSSLWLNENFISSINIPVLPSLRTIRLDENQLSSIDLTNVPSLTGLILEDNNLSTIDVTGLTNLQNLDLSRNNLSSIDISQNLLLTGLDVSSNNLNNLNFLNNNSISRLFCGSNNLTSLDLTVLPNLNNLSCYRNNITTLDVTNCQNDFIQFFAGDNDLQTMFLKNGFSINQLSFDNNPNLEYICANSGDFSTISRRLTSYGMSSVTYNDYCSFNANGSFNEIQGTISIDADNNGCNTTDPVFPNFNFTAINGTISGSISSNQQGAYYVPVVDGQHTITPNPENPTYWNFSPANVVVDFPTQASPFTQDFCVTANGSIEDLEVIVVPLEQARPGFDTDYKVVVKNKGNVTTSGMVTLDFEEDFMNLLSSTPTAAAPATNQLSWSVSNLLPFQMVEYELTMTLNTPTQTLNPLNGNDILTFTGTVTGTGTDAMPADNTMVFDQTVVNSYDPNDKTCLKGKTIDPSDVGEYVHYMIRFENTGTASAVNIVVKDEIDLAQFDITTLIPLGGSHDYYTRVRDNNVVEFIHENINLDFNDATNDGYVLFKIKTLSTLVAGDTFDNTADIFFDFNAPIITNTETVSIMSTASVGESTDSSISIYPNPAKNFITATANNAIEGISITDMNGRMITATQYTGAANEQRLEIGELSSGIYFVTIKSDAGQKIEKLLVE